MELRDDILFELDQETKSWELKIQGGDFVVGNSDLQHVAHILQAEQGQFRQFPFIGVGVIKMLNSTITGEEKRDIQLQLESDGYKPRKLKYDGEKLIVRL